VAELDDDDLGLVGRAARDDERLRHPHRRDPGLELHADTLKTHATAGGLPARARPASPAHGLARQAGGVVNALGNGVGDPVRRHLPAQRARDLVRRGGLALAFAGVTALGAGLRAGRRSTGSAAATRSLLGLLLQAAAFAMFPLIREPWHAFALLALEGVGTACFWPGQSTLLARLTPAENRHAAFALQRSA
jgi:hypothetical protein